MCNCIVGLYDNGLMCTTCFEGCQVFINDVFSCNCSAIPNVHWMQISNTVECDVGTYNLSNKCDYCSEGSVLNADLTGCYCGGNNT